MFRESTVHKWDIVTIQSRLLYTIPRTLNTLAIPFIGLLVTRNKITSFFVPLSVKGFLIYHRLEIFYTAISSVIDLWTKFVEWKCFGVGWCLMDPCRLNHFIRCRQIHSNNRWHEFHVSIRKLFGCMDHNLAWLYFSENDIFHGSAYVIHWDFAMMFLIAEPGQWLIQEHCSCEIEIEC